ncbi:uncharacterized protein LOC127861605 [Dreissena polymorpha]|uniref:CABIT domain-containing protein n=1 Tax=Dreissena polymorpha TaxID=45954 RepID=A0A9D3YED1_DREPO|nr:uncharacterized protein LOC127861605 [Dreissena polymorpha]KAH3696857.1 hypothetical protein DPMN_084337 [Dreissena polymorpha]
MFSRLFKHKENRILDRILHDKHVRSPFIASFLTGNGMAARQVYIEEKVCKTIRFVRIEVVPDPCITDPLLLIERKQYEGVQFCIPIQFHGLLKRCRKAISSIEEIPEVGVCSVVLRENALLLNDGDHAAVYVPSKTILAVVSLEKDHENKLVKAVFQDITGNKYIAKDVTPLVAYILVPVKRMTLEQYINGDNLRHSTVVTLDDIDEHDVASNDPMEFKKLKTILAGQVRVKAVEAFDFVVAFTDNERGHAVLLIPKEKLKDISAKLTTFPSDIGKADFICNHFQGCSYDAVITSKLYTIDPKNNTICHFSVTTPSQLDNVYEPDPTWVSNHSPKTSFNPRKQRFDSTPIATTKHIDPRKSKSESDEITEDDVYELVESDHFNELKIADHTQQSKDNSKMMRHTVSQDSFRHGHDNSKINDELVKSHLGLSYNPQMQMRRRVSYDDEDKCGDESLYLSPLSRRDIEVFTRLPKSKESNTHNSYDHKNSEHSNDDGMEDCLYMPMDGTCSLQNSKDNDDVEESEYVAQIQYLQGQAGNYEETDDDKSLKNVKAHTGDCDAPGGELSMERAHTPTGDYVDTDDVEALKLAQGSTRDYVAPDDVKALKNVQDLVGDYENPDYIEELRQTSNQMNSSACSRKQYRHDRSNYVNSDYSTVATEEKNDDVFEKGAVYISDDHLYDAPKYSRHSAEVLNNECESDCQIYDAPPSLRSLSEDLIKSDFESECQVYDASKSTKSVAENFINFRMESDCQTHDTPMSSRSMTDVNDAPKSSRFVTEGLIKNDTESESEKYDAPKSTRYVTENLIKIKSESDSQIYVAPKASRSISELYDAPKSSRSVNETEELLNIDPESDSQIYDAPKSTRSVTENCVDIKSESYGDIHDARQSSTSISELYDAPKSSRYVTETKAFINSNTESNDQVIDARKSLGSVTELYYASNASMSVTEDFIQSECESDCVLYDAPKSPRSVNKHLLNSKSQADSLIYDVPKSALLITAESTARESSCDTANEFVSKAGYYNEIAEYVNLGSFHREGGVRLS